MAKIYDTRNCCPNIKDQLKSSTENEKIEELTRKPICGQFYWDPERPSVDKEKYLVWLSSSGLKSKTESLIITAQDQGLNMHYHQRYIMKQPTDSKCRTSIRQNTYNILLWDAKHFHHLNTLIDTIRWLVTFTRYVNTQGYRLLKGL